VHILPCLGARTAILEQICKPLFCPFFVQDRVVVKCRGHDTIKKRSGEGQMKFIKTMAAVLLILIQVGGCTAYNSQYVPFRPPEAYANKQEVDGVAVGAEAYLDKNTAKEAFGFDIRDCGLLPVQLILNNLSGKTLQIVGDHTFLLDAQGNYWQVVANQSAVDRIEKSTQLAALGKGAGGGALWGAAGGAILGAAIGIASGHNVGEAMGAGAALGGAGGAIIGTGKEATSTDRQTRILNDIRTKGLEGKTIPIDHLANGFLFFPGEAKTAKSIKLQLRELESGKVLNVTLNLNN
jgi:hypothetical protein